MTFSTHLFSFSELVEDPDVYFMAHENPHLASLKDTIHPKMKGSSILAGNIGRHVFGVPVSYDSVDRSPLPGS